MAAALAAVKCHTPFAHVEAGLRSFDRSMPEEINRIVADHCSELFFAPTPRAAMNLIFEGCDPWKIHITGNTVVDSVLEMKKRAERESNILQQLDLIEDDFAVLTIHRPANVEEEETLHGIINGILSLKGLKLVLSLHPRTRQSLEELDLYSKLESAEDVIVTKPLGYLDFLSLMINSRVIITDSGGLQEEAFTLGKPCVTLRTNTERPESVELGANFLVGRSPDLLFKTIKRILKKPAITARIAQQTNPFGDGHAGKRIIDALSRFCQKSDVFVEPELFKTGTRNRILHSVDTKFVDKNIRDVEQQLQGKILILYDSEGHPIFPEDTIRLQRGQHFLLSIEK
jgi:UDP-N-acetylglucosamine 2-epimerase (non-hydrolysing)